MLKCGGGVPTGSKTYDQYSDLLQKRMLKNMEVETQQGYVTLLEQMVTHTTLTVPRANTTSALQQLGKELKAARKTLNKTVNLKIGY